MGRIIAVVNQKGGVGKTTTVVNLSSGLVNKKKKVLVIDLDPQAHLTHSLGISSEDVEGKNIYNVLKEEVAVESTIIHKYGIDIIPADLVLTGADLELSTLAGREFILKEILSRSEISSRKYDYIIIDCSPSLGILTLNAFTAAKEIFIPLQAEFLALKGISLLIQTYETVKARLNPELQITGIILTMFDSRKKLNVEVLDRITKYFPNEVFKTKIRSNVKLGEAPSFGKPIFHYDKDSNGATDYAKLTTEIIKIENDKNTKQARKRSA